MNYTTKAIADITGAALHGAGTQPVAHLLIDSRKLSHITDALFFALRGDRHDGHLFITDLYARGMRAFVVEYLPENHAAAFPDADFIVTPDSLQALQDLCAFHRKQFTYPVIGITGSNGKTVVKEWLYQLLHEDFSIVRSPKSFNSQVGVPLSVWQMQKEHQLALFEAGISRPGEMVRLQRMIAPTIGLFTNIGQAHDENFIRPGEKIDEKLQLFQTCETLIYCKDNANIHERILGDPALHKKKLFSWSGKTKADLQLARVTRFETETEIQAVYQLRFETIRIPFTDDASVENAMHCWAVMLHFGIPQETITTRMASLTPVAMRLELKEGINNCSVINDSYNSDLGSLAVAIDFLNQQHQHERHTLILSDILQSGRSEQALYAEVAALLSKKGIHRLIGIGEAICRNRDLFEVPEKNFYTDTASFLQSFSISSFRDETILLKGARAFGFEAISKVLQQKTHETVLEINLNALVHNLNYFRSRLQPGTKLMAMVKALSYGSGSFEIANVLQFHRADYLAVAYADEGIELRKAGITLPIMVMNPEEQSYDAMIQFRLEPEIYSFRVLSLFDEAAQRQRRIGEDIPPLPVHIKLDTGMRRLGFEEADLNELIVRLRNNKQLVVRSVFSHLAGSDEPVHDGFTKQQVDRFAAMSGKLQQHLGVPFLRHILNSAGISRFPDAQFDMVRLGIGMYGIGVTPEEQALLQNVSTLKTTISQIKNVPEGETIGYSRKGKAMRPTQIATVPIGYADGLNRRLSNGQGVLWVNGQAAPIIGNVCMDMCMIDITGISAREGDEVIVFGDAASIGRMAKDLGTIPYEVLTNVSARVKRVYFQE